VRFEVNPYLKVFSQFTKLDGMSLKCNIRLFSFLVEINRGQLLLVRRGF